ncbi:hypothetical protein JB92DRAFT_2992064 [Gautieria morchelliformis]|nr:hypothetical protein JB92DRAFT_2992064 [Gautieria morchelliformis]
MVGNSNFLVPRGTKSSRKHEEGHSKQLVLHGGTGKNTEPHPSTSRALVLRSVAYGSGEVAFSRKISGQEKLSLLANDMMTGAIRAPFRIDKLLKMAESQLGVHLDEISNLKDKDFFCNDILATINSRVESAPDKNGVRRPPIDDTRWVAFVVGCRIHNVYLLAGAWRIVRNILRELEAIGLDDRDVRGQLRASEKIRARYLVLYDIITMLARMGQQRVASIAAATAHYAPYFVRRTKAGHDGEMEFDHHGSNPRKIREAHRSFIDAIILELVLPDSEYPPYVLMTLLHGAVEECRKEEKRFSQDLWDSMGDFSVTVEVLDVLEGPLLGPEGESWIKGPSLSKEFNEFLRVQALSGKASQDIESWKSCLKPLLDTKKEHVLNQLWYNINKASGVTIDALWSLQNDLQRSPQWSTYYIPGLNGDGSDPDQHALVLHKEARRAKTEGSRPNRLQLKDDDDDDDEMPPLLTASDTSDEEDTDPDASDDEERSEGDSESDYDPAEDDLLHDMLREALDAAIEMDLLGLPDDYPASAEKMSSNPFTRMLANLKDRCFPANPALRVNEGSRNRFKARPGTTPTIPSTSQAPGASSANQARRDSDTDDLPPLEPPGLHSTLPSAPTSEGNLPPLQPSNRKFQVTTIEEVEDEDNTAHQKKKKKKKKKKNVKKPQEVPSPSQLPPVKQSESFSPSPSTPSRTAKQSPSKESPGQSIKSLVGAVDASFSRTSLPLAPETTAQSARAYIQSENLTTEKTKVKTRPAFAAGFFKPDKKAKECKDSGTEKKGLLGRMKRTITLPKRLSNAAMQLFSSDDKTQPMKWEKFLKARMGFSYDPSTAGSSVRFDPPDPKDPVTHPDSTLQRSHVQAFKKRLQKCYGWSPELFSTLAAEEEYDSD